MSLEISSGHEPVPGGKVIVDVILAVDDLHASHGNID